MTSTSSWSLRVLYVARAPFVSGAERALRSMLTYLDRKQIQPSVILGHETSLASDIRKLDIPVEVIELPKRSLGTFFPWRRSLQQIRRVIADFQPDLLHANDVPSSQAVSVLGKRLNIPRLVHVRWTITASQAAWWMPDSAQTLLCISQYIQQKLGSAQNTSLATARIQVLHDAVDWPATSPTVARKPPSSSDRPKLGFAGQLIESKGLELLIRAMSLVPWPQRPELRIAGSDTQTGGQYQQYLQKLAQSLGVADDIRWLGFLSDVGELYRQVDAVACPSLEEPLGLIPLEAAAYRLPALANRLGGFLETIEPNTTGWLIEPTPEAWAAAIARLRDRLTLSEMGDAAMARTRRLFSPKVYQHRLFETYRGLKEA